MTIYVDDWGTIFRMTVMENGVMLPIDGATAMKMRFYKPDATVVEVDASWVTDGTDGQMQYTAIEGFLDQYGKWKRQGWVAWATGEWSGTMTEFRVEKRLVPTEPVP